MLKQDRYGYRVIWSEDDNEYLGLCTEFKGLSWLAETQEEALRGIKEVVADVVADMKEAGEKIPEPIALKKFSGKFQIRLLPEQHRNLTFLAAESGVSLNRFACAKLCTD